MTLRQKVQAAEKFVILLDSKFKVGSLRFGIDPLLGLIPGVGDFLPLFMSGYLIFIAVQHNLSQLTIAKMIFYAAADFVVGSIPILGDVTDFFFKSHMRNLNLIKKEIGLLTTK